MSSQARVRAILVASLFGVLLVVAACAELKWEQAAPIEDQGRSGYQFP